MNTSEQWREANCSEQWSTCRVNARAEKRSDKSAVSGSIRLRIVMEVEGEEHSSSYHAQYSCLHEVRSRCPSLPDPIAPLSCPHRPTRPYTAEVLFTAITVLYCAVGCAEHLQQHRRGQQRRLPEPQAENLLRAFGFLLFLANHKCGYHVGIVLEDPVVLQDMWSHYFGTPHQELVDEFAQRYRVERAFQTQTHLACLIAHYTRSGDGERPAGVLSSVSSLLAHVNAYLTTPTDLEMRAHEYRDELRRRHSLRADGKQQENAADGAAAKCEQRHRHDAHVEDGSGSAAADGEDAANDDENDVQALTGEAPSDRLTASNFGVCLAHLCFRKIPKKHF